MENIILLWIAVFCVSLIMSFLLQILFHEIGHMLCGLFTGWKLIYLQFFHIVLTKDESKFLRIVPSSACQCIMSPKSMKSNPHPYTLGGLIANLIITSISFYGMLVNGHETLLFLISICFFSSGVGLLVTNGKPRINYICNDMACFLITKKDKRTKFSHNAQFIIADKLSQGKSYYEMEATLFDTFSIKEINDITAYHILLEYYYHMDRDEFMAAKKALLRINDLNKVSKSVKCTYKMELLYLHMILSIYGCDAFTNNLLPCRENEEQYLEDNRIQGDIHAYRVEAIHQAYERIRETDILGAKETLCKSIYNLKDIPCIYSGEKLFCQDQLSAILNILQRMTTSEVEGASLLM